jgi:hypothetical protein
LALQLELIQKVVTDSDSEEEKDNGEDVDPGFEEAFVDTTQDFEMPTEISSAPRANNRRHKAAILIQKVYKGYRERNKYVQQKAEKKKESGSKMRASAIAFQPRAAKQCLICGLSTDSPRHSVSSSLLSVINIAHSLKFIAQIWLLWRTVR